MTDYERLKQIIDEIPALIDANVVPATPNFQAWKTKAERFLIQHFGNNSIEHTSFIKTRFVIGMAAFGSPVSTIVKTCREGLETTQNVFQSYLDEMADEKDNNESAERPLSLSSIFIVHGHDGELKESVARIIEKQGIEAIILSEKANPGKTIIEKLEGNDDVGGAICLFTADDMGRSQKVASDTPRARQNVVFETGYFMGKLGRDRIVILADHGVELPSDLSGVVYTSTTNWQFELLKELKQLGYAVDLNKLI